MPRLDVSVRSPTGPAWVSSAVFFIIAGELLHELRKEVPAELFHIGVSDGTLLIGVILFGALAAGSLAWLVSLYMAPGRLVLVPESSTLRREWRRFIWRDNLERPLAEWQVRIVYFSGSQRHSGVFKRLELRCEHLQEVLLLDDFDRGEEVSKALEAAAGSFALFQVQVETGDGSNNGGADQTTPIDSP